jgi:hypothetical protein
LPPEEKIMHVKFAEQWKDWDGENDILTCPSCGYTYMHHVGVEVFDRDREDSETGLHLSVEPGGVVRMDTKQAGNPSSRRDGVRIYLWCEGCPEKSVLTIAQHKGLTLVGIKPVAQFPFPYEQRN